MDAPYKAFLFDLNGTMIDDMEYHVQGWFKVLNKELGATLTEKEVRKQMYGKNAELLERVFGKGHFSDQEIYDISMKKEERYQQAFLPVLKLIDGLPEFLEAAQQKDIKMAIGSAAMPFNINFVLDNLKLRHYFKVVISADDVKYSKPHPETYLLAAKALGVDPKQCVVFEDAPKGVEAAENAGMAAIVLTTMHEAHEFGQYNNIIGFAGDYTAGFFQNLI